MGRAHLPAVEEGHVTERQIYTEAREPPEAEAHVEALQRRVAELEEKLGSKRPPDVCQACGERQVRLSWSAPSSTRVLIHQAWSCKACGFVETRYVHPIKA